MEHYLELYSTRNIVTDTALNALPGLPVIEELDNTPTLEELSIAIYGLACSKAPGKDRIPPEVPVDSPLWQRVVDDLCQTRAATQRIPPPLPSAPAAHQTGQSHQHRGPGARWLSKHAIISHSATPSMAQPCTSHGA